VGHGLRFVQVAGAVGLVALLLGVAGPAFADGGESISTYDTRIDVHADGSMKVTETIAYDFGANRRHGIFRYIPDRFPHDDRHVRTYPVDGVSVARDDKPEQFVQFAAGDNLEIQIGDPDNGNVTGKHTYVIAYTVRGAVNAFSDHEELYWNAVGSGWTVPIAAATAEVTGPSPVQKVGCYTGPAGSTDPCASATSNGTGSAFAQTGLGDGKDLTTVVSFPAGSIANPGPILERREDLGSAFRVAPVTVGGGAGLALVGSAVALVAAWRFGRDRRYVGQLPGLTPGYGESAVEERKPLIGRPPDVVEFGPPDKIRPGQVGTLIDEKADVVDVTATIVDFAVRRHLLIKEIGERKDWELVRQLPLRRGSLLYERTLYAALFRHRDSVTLSTLKRTFAADLARVRRDLYLDMVQQGWYRRSPRQTRFTARLVAGGILLAAVGVTVGLAFLGLGLVGAGLVVAALVLLVVAGTFPARTGKGSAALARLRGFRLYIATAEAEQIKFQERVQIFSEFLPYAIVFGLADRWAGIFSKIGAFDAGAGVGPGVSPLYWYTGSYAFTAGSFSASMHGFTSSAGAAVSASAATPSSSGSSGFDGAGFSGGGGGGGGGGSW